MEFSVFLNQPLAMKILIIFYYFFLLFIFRIEFIIIVSIIKLRKKIFLISFEKIIKSVMAKINRHSKHDQGSSIQILMLTFFP